MKAKQAQVSHSICQIVFCIMYYVKFCIDTRNFDLQVSLKPDVKSEAKEYTFNAIDRSEYHSLADFFTAKSLNVIIPEVISLTLSPRNNLITFYGRRLPSSVSRNKQTTMRATMNPITVALVPILVAVVAARAVPMTMAVAAAVIARAEGLIEVRREVNHLGRKLKTRSQRKSEQRRTRMPLSKAGPHISFSLRLFDPRYVGPAAPSIVEMRSVLRIYNALDQIIEDNPGIKAADVLKEAGNRWKALSTEDKAVYEEEAKKDKERYGLPA
jgi:hypothetical protein